MCNPTASPTAMASAAGVSVVITSITTTSSGATPAPTAAPAPAATSDDGGDSSMMLIVIIIGILVGCVALVAAGWFFYSKQQKSASVEPESRYEHNEEQAHSWFQGKLCAIPAELQSVLPNGIPPLPPGCKWHFFISKQEACGKELAEVIARTLQNVGFKVWLSQDFQTPDEDAMREGVLQSAVVLLLMTHGIFRKERDWVTRVELLSAIAAKKAIIGVNPGGTNGFDLDTKTIDPSCPDECLAGVTDYFQPYARAITRLTVLGWATQIDDRMSKLKQIVRQYNERDGIVIKLQDAIKRQSGVAPVGANAAADEWDPSVSFKLRQHDAATDETRDKYHASYKSQDAQVMMEAMDGISRAGALCTVVHNAQSSDWFQTWKPKCLAARGVIVIYSENYRSNFTMALQKEAEVILNLYRKKATTVFVLDPVLHSSADLRVCIMDKSAGMGDIQGWIKFITPFIAKDGHGRRFSSSDDTRHSADVSANMTTHGAPAVQVVVEE